MPSAAPSSPRLTHSPLQLPVSMTPPHLTQPSTPLHYPSLSCPRPSPPSLLLTPPPLGLVTDEDSTSASSPLCSPSMPSVWQCPYRCGCVYSRSSGRSIRRHIVRCFRSHNPSAESMSDAELSAAIQQQHDSGQLTTGLRRWKMRQPRRLARQLSDGDRWDCVWGCGKSYRATSSRSIQRHTSECARRTMVGTNVEERSNGADAANTNIETVRKRVKGGEDKGGRSVNRASGDASTHYSPGSHQGVQHALTVYQQPCHYAATAVECPPAVGWHFDDCWAAGRQRVVESTDDAVDRCGVNGHYLHSHLHSSFHSADPLPVSHTLVPRSLPPSPPPLASMSSDSYTSTELGETGQPQQWEQQCSSPPPPPLSFSDLLLNNSPIRDLQPYECATALLPTRPPWPPSRPQSALPVSAASSSLPRVTAVSAPSAVDCAAPEIDGQLRSLLIFLYLRDGTRHPVFEKQLLSPWMLSEAILAATAMQAQRSH